MGNREESVAEHHSIYRTLQQHRLVARRILILQLESRWSLWHTTVNVSVIKNYKLPCNDFDNLLCSSSCKRNKRKENKEKQINQKVVSTLRLKASRRMLFIDKSLHWNYFSSTWHNSKGGEKTPFNTSHIEEAQTTYFRSQLYIYFAVYTSSPCAYTQSKNVWDLCKLWPRYIKLRVSIKKTCTVEL